MSLRSLQIGSPEYCEMVKGLLRTPRMNSTTISGLFSGSQARGTTNFLFIQGLLDDNMFWESEAMKDKQSRRYDLITKAIELVHSRPDYLRKVMHFTDLVNLKVPFVRESNTGSPITVYEASIEGSRVAVKYLRDSSLLNGPPLDNANINAIFEDIARWRFACHTNIVTAYGTATLENRIPAWVLPWLDSRRSIVEYIKTLNPAPTTKRLNTWLLHIAQGLEHLHSVGMYHGSLHAGNVYINENGVAQLTDITMACFSDRLRSALNHRVQRARWLAPENFQAFDDEREYDLFAFACVCIEVYTLKVPFPEIKHSIQVLRHYNGGHKPWQPNGLTSGFAMGANMWGLVNSCWVDTKTLRPTISDVVADLKNIVDQE